MSSQQSDSGTPNRYDIAIIGGGMVGASLALGLAKSLPKLRITVLEAFPIPENSGEFQPSFDARATALSMSTRRYYEQIAIWSQLESKVTPIHDIHVSDRGHFGSVRLNHSDQNVDALGYMVENRQLGNTLLAQVRRSPSIEWRCPAKVERVEMIDNGARLTCAQDDENDGEHIEIEAKLAVVADGGHSGLVTQLGIAQDRHDYNQIGIIANISSDQPHQNRAYERFTKRGPMALLPLDGHRSALVWTLEEDQAEQVLALDDRAFLDELQRSFGHRAGNFERVGNRHSYPFVRVQAREQVRSNIVILGNAAHALHPVAGQSFNLSLRDTGALIEALKNADTNGQPIGSIVVLDAYYRQQRWDQDKTIGTSQALVEMFTHNNSAVTILRDLGLLMMEGLPPAKAWFNRQASGLSGRAAQF
ncbi:MAG: 2-octaprenyl-6-methoxyphenyl hydroxylase [Pseudomonadales bacterium]|nr:2-octaprenyl-6-methoxyphenyl hydroxylase [Pseudomonadales bacterium]